MVNHNPNISIIFIVYAEIYILTSHTIAANAKRHDMERFSLSPVVVQANYRSTLDSPHKGPEMSSFDIFFIVGLNNRLNKKSR